MSRAEENSMKKELEQLVEKAARLRDSIYKLVVARVRRVVIKCSLCRKGTQLSNRSFLQDWWYTSPRGCNEGDYWNKTETSLCHIFCPKCGKWEYIHNHPQKKQILQNIEEQGIDKKKIFYEIWEQHGRNEAKQIFPEP